MGKHGKFEKYLPQDFFLAYFLVFLKSIQELNIFAASTFNI